MTLGQRLTQAAGRAAEGVTPPIVDLDVIRSRARRSRRRRTSLVAAAGVMAMIAVGATVVANRGTGAPEPVPAPSPTSVASVPTPEPDPFPTSMTLEEVVAHPAALLSTVAVDPADPDTRMSIWSYSCTRPCPERGPHSFSAMAVTTDGYETTTYVRPSFPLGVDLHVSSPTGGVFLVVDVSNGGEWLVDVAAGTVRKVRRVSTPLAPTDPRLWFFCSGGWRENWCALDLGAATAYQWPKAWQGSAVRPGGTDLPWGTNPKPRPASRSGRLEAWWDTESGRRLRTLAVAYKADYILDTPPGEMAFWARPLSESVDIYTSSNGGADWERETRSAPGLAADVRVRRSPDGSYLAYSTFPRLQVWRAEASGGAFHEVYQQPELTVPETSGTGLWAQDDLVYISGFATVAVSSDDGLTWATVQTWK